jgi:hypothetical protein
MFLADSCFDICIIRSCEIACDAVFLSITPVLCMRHSDFSKRQNPTMTVFLQNAISVSKKRVDDSLAMSKEEEEEKALSALLTQRIKLGLDIVISLTQLLLRS